MLRGSEERGYAPKLQRVVNLTQCALHGMLMTSQVPSKSVLIRVDDQGKYKYTHLAVE